MKVSSEQEMLGFGAEFAQKIKNQANPSSVVIELVGDVGVGKTTFTRGFAKALGAVEPVTSPSFTISKTYALPDEKTLIHYDFYRLSNPGLMVEDLADNLENKNNIILIEWGEEVKNILPKDHITINFSYNDDNTREIKIS